MNTNIILKFINDKIETSFKFAREGYFNNKDFAMVLKNEVEETREKIKKEFNMKDEDVDFFLVLVYRYIIDGSEIITTIKN